MRWGEGWIKERPRSDGTVGYQARWLDEGSGHDPTERAKTFNSRDAAEDFLREQLRAKRDGRYSPPSEITLRELMDAWLLRGASRWKANTLYVYRQRAKLYVYPLLGDLPLATITTPRLQHWVDGLIRAGRHPATVNAGVIVLKQALREAVAIGIIASNPSIGIRRPTIRQARAVTWTVADVTKLIAVVSREPMWHALYRLALTTGLRPGELRGLRWGDIDIERGIIQVRRTISRDAQGRTIMGQETKTGRDRSVAAPVSAMKALASWRVAQKVRRVGSATWADDGIVFDRGNGQFLDATVWRYHHRQFIEAAGIPVITLHELRHSNATLELEAGTHPLIVSQRLGHSTIAITLDKIFSCKYRLTTRSGRSIRPTALRGGCVARCGQQRFLGCGFGRPQTRRLTRPR